MKRREEEKSYAGWFALSALLLVLLSAWVVWWEAVSLRPWKRYQREYYRLEQTSLREELQQLAARQHEHEFRLGRVRPAQAATGALQAAEPSASGLAQRPEVLGAKSFDQELHALEARKQTLDRRLKELQEAPIAIQQIYLPQLGRTDRCQSCHIAIHRPVAVSRQHPFAPHPGRFIFLDKHPTDQFGCTLCHWGQGRATSSAKKAHGQVPYWLEPMPDRDHTSASCLRCHADPSTLRGAERLREGLELFRRYACYGCHKLAGYENLPKPGPPLTNIGTKVNYTWLVKWIKNPRSLIADARMPNFGLSDEEAQAVADYLFNFTRRERVDSRVPAIPAALAEMGRSIYNTSRCSLCHRANDRGGEFKEVYATDLSLEGSKIQQIEWLVERIREPKKAFPDTVMPRYRFTEPNLRALASFLAAEFVDPELEESKRTIREPIAQSSIERGRELVRRYGCFNCHEIRGFEKEAKIGPEITRVGSKPLEQFDFGRTEIERTRKRWFATKLKTPRVFSSDLRMPNYGLQDIEIQALTTVLLGLTGEKLPPEYLVAAPSADFTVAGEAGRLLDDVKCLTCHSIRGRGGKFAPDLSFEGSAVKRAWLREFLKSPDIIRPLLKQMPKFNLTDREVAVLVDFITTTLVDDRIPNDAWEAALLDPRAVRQGEEIYRRRGCRACHQIGAVGGALGPNLTSAGKRLTAGYLYAHTKQAHIFRPDIIEPRYNLSDAEATALTDYLRNLVGATTRSAITYARQEP